MLSAMHYDNRADPLGYKNRQFGWRTDFNHVGLNLTLPGDIGLLAQWMDGATVWGRLTNGIYSIDVEFESNYLLLTKLFERHRASNWPPRGWRYLPTGPPGPISASRNARLNGNCS